MFSVNVRTIHRRLPKFNLGTATGISRFSVISDDHLDEACRDILKQFPNCGVRRMRGFLRDRHIHITWERTMEVMRRVDVESVIMQLNITHRRVYSVKGPLSLWHIDGNHTLIRRVVKFMVYSTNNKLQMFQIRVVKEGGSNHKSPTDHFFLLSQITNRGSQLSIIVTVSYAFSYYKVIQHFFNLMPFICFQWPWKVWKLISKVF